jgi:hypothetical protein
MQCVQGSIVAASASWQMPAVVAQSMMAIRTIDRDLCTREKVMAFMKRYGIVPEYVNRQ